MSWMNLPTVLNETIMNKTVKDLIIRWYEKSQQPQQGEFGIFDQFISLWIAFNAYYATENIKCGWREQQNRLIRNHRDQFTEIIKARKNEFEAFQLYIKEKPQNSGFIEDLKYGGKKLYQDLGSFKEYLDCIYQIRCNLFHGGKDVADAQDKELVHHAFVTLSILLSEIITVEMEN